LLLLSEYGIMMSLYRWERSEGRSMEMEEIFKEICERSRSDERRLADDQELIAKYGSLFHPSNLDSLTREHFKSFLSFKNNKHWHGIHRQGNLITRDMDRLRSALKILLDEKQPIRERLDRLFPQAQPGYIKGLGKAVATAILITVYPDKYPTYTSRSEVALKKLGLHPEFSGEGFAERYLKIREITCDLAERYDMSLLQINGVFGQLADIDSEMRVAEDEEVAQIEGYDIESWQDFGLESHLEDFLVENWEKTPLGKRYSLLEEDGDMVGQQYTTNIGRIDLLAKEKKTGDWVVIELKKGRPASSVVGQLTTYMGWVKDNLARGKEEVKGVIIAGEADEKLEYAVRMIPSVEFFTYSIKFDLQQVT